MKITFYGAAETVTGSCYLVETKNHKFLVDCGMFQGGDVEYRNSEEFDFNPREIEFVILTHAHMDHAGLLPKLVRKGFEGKVYLTTPTAELLEHLLLDSAKIQERNMQNQKYSTSQSKKFGDLLYDTKDALRTIELFESVQFNVKLSVSKYLRFELLLTGHILGAASAHIYDEEKLIVFSGDIGRRQQSVINSYSEEVTTGQSVDAVIMESLYGGELHPERKISEKKLIDDISSTLGRDGNVIIPCFALHRTQEILQLLKNAYKKRYIDRNVQVFLDSPLAWKLMKVYTQNNSMFNSYNGGKSKNRFYFDNLQIIRHHKHSLRLKKKKRSIFIAGSGMADGGRVMNHIAHNIQSDSNAVAFVGYQAEGTLGRDLVDGASEIEIGKKKLKVKATIKHLHGFSAHGDNDDLLAWLSRYKMSKEAKVYLVHADKDRASALAANILPMRRETYIPAWKESVEI